MVMGRPSKFTQVLADEICKRLAKGESLRGICEDEHIPCRETILRWLDDDRHADFRLQYARAREAQADYLAEEILQIADDATNNWMVKKFGEEYVTVYDREHADRSKMRIDARKWFASKLAPKKYGEKITQEVTGKDGDPLIPVLNLGLKTK